MPGVPGKFLFFFTGLAVGLGLEFGSWANPLIVEGIESPSWDIISSTLMNLTAALYPKVAKQNKPTPQAEAAWENYYNFKNWWWY